MAEKETYEENAIREIEEELGIKNIFLEPLFIIKYEDKENKENKVFNKGFKCVYDGMIKLQKEEIISGRFMPVKELKELIKKERFVPEGIIFFKKYLKEDHGKT